MRHRRAAAIAAIVSAVAFAGCGLGPGPGTSNVSLTVTRDFGSRGVGAITKSHVSGSETVMRMLQRSFGVDTRYGGGFVESINGLSGTSSERDWFYYVNGVEASQGAAQTPVRHGDHIWWDLHDWEATDSIPAVVGSFPEPFVHGINGKRLPTVLECASDVSVACDRVSSALRVAGVPVARQLFGTGSGTDSLAMLVGTWADLRGTLAGALVGRGPKSSGVYANFTGSSLRLLDPRGRVVRTLGSGAGLVAATAQGQSTPAWLVTGTDAAGVTAAASAVNANSLHDRFALAVLGGARLAVPQNGGA